MAKEITAQNLAGMTNKRTPGDLRSKACRDNAVDVLRPGIPGDTHSGVINFYVRFAELNRYQPIVEWYSAFVFQAYRVF